MLEQFGEIERFSANVRYFFFSKFQKNYEYLNDVKLLSEC